MHVATTTNSSVPDDVTRDTAIRNFKEKATLPARINLFSLQNCYRIAKMKYTEIHAIIPIILQ